MVSNIGTSRDAEFAPVRSSILVVEDELLIRLMVSDELREAGYDVVEACDADEALVVLGTSTRIDLVISDVRMPGSIDGLELLAVLRTNYPTIPVIITSGHLEPRVALQDGAAQFLAKPFTLCAVMEAVESEMERIQ
jgi:CheY-like chemotaxis protein